MSGHGIFNPNSENLVELNGTCLPANGTTGGFEIVYDFKHIERGLFSYSGNLVNFGNWYGVNGVAYIGKTRGFAKEPDYNTGVTAYEGYSAAADVSLNLEVPEVPSLSGGIVGIWGAPLDKNKTLNKNGVFASYFGVSGGGGASYIPFVGADLAVAEYTILFNGNWPAREPYVSPVDRSILWWQDKSIEEAKQEIPYRIKAAAQMQAELMTFAVLQPETASHIAGSIGQLWRFVFEP
jgi:hypothetical protein